MIGEVIAEVVEDGEMWMMEWHEQHGWQKHTLLNGRYRIEQRLASRPHVTLYSGRKYPRRTSRTMSSSGSRDVQQESLVAIREIVLTDFSPIVRAQIEAAAVEEFASPSVFNSSHLPCSGDRAWRENDCLYLALQLDTRLAASSSVLSASTPDTLAEPMTLDRMLLDTRVWPTWLDERVALEWSVQLCRMVARLHHQGVVLGNLNPCTILVYAHEEHSEYERIVWSPLLLPCWPPAPCYWQGGRSESQTYQMFVAHDYATAFPIGRRGSEDAFAAPEMLHESRTEVTERADIYSLGAILYLLLTHYAPICAASRISSEQNMYSPAFDTSHGRILLQPRTYSISPRFERRRQTHQSKLARGASGVYSVYEEQAGDEQGLVLLDPRTLNANIPVKLAEIILCALDLEPEKRFASAFALVEALEGMQNK